MACESTSAVSFTVEKHCKSDISLNTQHNVFIAYCLGDRLDGWIKNALDQNLLLIIERTSILNTKN
jgi:hypothetical protein